MEEKLKGKEAVKTSLDADGNIELSYASDSMRGLSLATFLALPVCLVSCVGGVGMAQAAGAEGTTDLLVGSIFSIICVPLFIFFLTRRKEKITIVKDKGIKFLKQELPFSSIDKLKIQNRKAEGAPVCVVVAAVRGRDIDITRAVTPPIADKIFRDVISNSPNLIQSR